MSSLSVSQDSSGAITATLSLSSSLLSSFPSTASQVSASFDGVSVLPHLCDAVAGFLLSPKPSFGDSCPPGLSAPCLVIKCPVLQDSVQTSGTYQIKASFQVCPSGQSSCVALVAKGGTPGKTIRTTASPSQQPTDNGGSSGPSGVVVAVIVAGILLLLGIAGVVVIRKREQRKRRREDTLRDLTETYPTEPVSFETRGGTPGPAPIPLKQQEPRMHFEPPVSPAPVIPSPPIKQEAPQIDSLHEQEKRLERLRAAVDSPAPQPKITNIAFNNAPPVSLSALERPASGQNVRNDVPKKEEAVVPPQQPQQQQPVYMPQQQQYVQQDQHYGQYPSQQQYTAYPPGAAYAPQYPPAQYPVQYAPQQQQYQPVQYPQGQPAYQYYPAGLLELFP
ncbi:hypothetical protein BCR33DRAFT_723241 [Rhizoclosmatium globosum]|uniref:Uncharacterized protein n=1 Tax=Rhizoclosmatium globosum TaxID=329046 RepID=A0A1Y2BFK2_9FUNG|nr:hypothetical protein BCR33DRAFT_723241 [Rhizoclosmatium globosum]|eukprot:ORY33267.1 hypothetical protein BCR33DRAFT_723241 [Rhizoclosmatium globosum]